MNTSATAQILELLLLGKTLSQLDCSWLHIEDIRTPISHLKRKLAQQGLKVDYRWITTKKGSRIKQYWAVTI